VTTGPACTISVETDQVHSSTPGLQSAARETDGKIEGVDVVTSITMSTTTSTICSCTGRAPVVDNTSSIFGTKGQILNLNDYADLIENQAIIQIANDCVKNAESDLKLVRLRRNEIYEAVSRTCREISVKCDQLTGDINTARQGYTSVVDSFKDARLKEIENENDKLGSDIVLSVVFQKYVEIIHSCGDKLMYSRDVEAILAQEIIKCYNDLQIRAVWNVVIKFIPAYTTSEGVEAKVGVLTVEDQRLVS